jgi:hypothetical protein
VVPPGTVAILPDQGDPRRIGELLAAWVGAKLAEVDDLVEEARSRVDALPDQKTLWLLFGEALVRLHCVELELAQLKAARR